MKRVVLLLGIFLIVSSGSSLYAQSLEKDTWVGRMMVPSGKIDTLYMYVDPGKEGLKIDIESREMGRFSGKDVRHDEHTLYFSWNYDMEIDCALYSQENASYQGTCSDEKGNKGLFVFVPSRMADSPESTQIFEDWVHYWKGKLK